MTTLIFGATSSPCSAQYVMNKNAAEFRKNYPASVRAIERNHYVDDYLDSEDTVEEGIQRIKEVTKIHKKGGFEIRGWVSNDARILEGISNEKTANKAVNLTSDPTERALGLKWNLNSDTIGWKTSLHSAPGSLLPRNGRSCISRNCSQRDEAEILDLTITPNRSISVK
ncbi:uncharacterized protein LOC122504626 [Leptopilina heterotoma]|uniref:uncharacterized protein LOC122504626 n=1 Tax=Leptopilina heterotoma TaxID=63436 RepID=UPI001CA900A1|nr:uncharacterized protein LOC122504626 [Leptopilina heterotoma]